MKARSAPEGSPTKGSRSPSISGGAPITAVARRPNPPVSGWKRIATSAPETSRVPSQIAWRAEAASVLRASSRVASMTEARSSTWLWSSCWVSTSCSRVSPPAITVSRIRVPNSASATVMIGNTASRHAQSKKPIETSSKRTQAMAIASAIAMPMTPPTSPNSTASTAAGTAARTRTGSWTPVARRSTSTIANISATAPMTSTCLRVTAVFLPLPTNHPVARRSRPVTDLCTVST